MTTASITTHSAVFMNTIVSIRVVTPQPASKIEEKVQNAFAWFCYTEETCNRFDERSEISRLSCCIGKPVRVSNILFHTLRFSLAIARLTEGAFDPTLGYVMEKQGFNRNYLTGTKILSTRKRAGQPVGSGKTTFRDVKLNSDKREVTLLRPLKLDVGAVAKGLAIDLAAKELNEFSGFFVEAGGDVYVKGKNEFGEPWRVGISHPRVTGKLFGVVCLSGGAVCNSGDYETNSNTKNGSHHLIDPQRGSSPKDIASVTVIAPTAMLADALSTAAFICGAQRGLDLLKKQRVDGMIVSSSLATYITPDFEAYLHA